MTWLSVRAALLASLAAVLVGLLALLAWGPGAGEPHGARIGVVAPGAAGHLIVDTVEAGLPGSEPLIWSSDTSARRAVRGGELDAALVVDFVVAEDTVLVDPGRDPALHDVLVSRLESVVHGHGHELVVADLATPASEGRAHRVDLAVGTATAGGFVLGLAVTVLRWVRGRRVVGVPRTALVLVPASALLGLLLSAAPALDTGNPAWQEVALLGSCVLLNAALAVLCAAAAGALGLAVAAAVELTFVAPLITHVDNLLLPQPWAAFFPFTTPGATREALAHLGEGHPWRAIVVIVAWLVAMVAAGSAIGRSTRRWEAELPLLRAAAAAAPATAVLLVAAALLPTEPPVLPRTQPLASTTRCLDVGRPDDVDDLNRITREFRAGDDFGGGDVGATVRLQDGRRLWLFGDTLREPGGHPTFVRNSMLVFDDDCLAVVMPEGGGAVIPDRDRDVGYWPMSVARSAATGYDLVAVTVQRVRATGEGPWDFEVLGPAVAIYVVPVGRTPQLMGVVDVGPDDADRTRPMWGAAAAVDDGWLYLYGTATPGEPYVFGHSLHVARMRPDDVVRPERWTYWDGTAWSDDEDAAVELVPAVDGTSQTLSVWRGGDTWYALSKRNDFLGSEIVVWTAPGPTGPFTAQPPVGTLPSNLDEGQLRYMPLAHPDLLPEPGTVVVSWSNNRSDTSEVFADPMLYRPRFARVRLP